MSGEMEAAGAVLTAGLVAGAIEKGDAHGAAEHGACPNCGAELHGEFCAHCGQPAHIHRTLGHMVEEFLHGILHFDTRAWRTLPLLVFRPGTLTHEYIHGKRARYISPLAMFLLFVFTMFAVFAFTGGDAIKVGTSEGSGHAEPIIVKNADGTETRTYNIDMDREDIFEQIRLAYERGDITINSSIPYLDEKLKHKFENPELAFYKVQNAAYKFAFLLVPISLPLVWLLFFWKRGMTLFDHTVYILYSLSFVSLLFIVMALMSRGPDFLKYLIPWLVLSIPIHAYFQMKGGYSLGWFSALWRTPMMMLLAVLGLAFFLVAIILVGVAG